MVNNLVFRPTRLFFMVLGAHDSWYKIYHTSNVVKCVCVYRKNVKTAIFIKPRLGQKTQNLDKHE